MKRIIARLYITIITVLILFGLIYLYNQVRVSRNEYIQTSMQVADETKEIIETNWYKYKNFENQALTDSLKQLMNSEINIHSIIIYSKEKGLTKFTSRYNDSDFLLNSLVPDDPTWNLRPEYSFSWWERYNNNRITTPLQINERGYAFDLIYNVLSTQKVNKVFGEAFVIVAIFLVLTIFVIIIFTVWKNKYSIKEYDDDFEHSGGMINDDFEQSESVDTGTDFGDETSDDLDFDSDDLGDMDFDSDDSFDDLDDFDIMANEVKSEVGDINNDTVDNLDDFGALEDDFDMDIGSEDSAQTSDLDDFDLDFGSDDIEQTSVDTTDDSLDDFDLDFGSEDDEQTSVDDFDLDFGSEDNALESVDDFDMEFDSEDNADTSVDTTDDSLDDFDLDFGSEDNALESVDDFDMEFGSEDNVQTSDTDLDDFDLDTSDTDLDDFDLDTSDTDLEDFDLDTSDELDTDLEDFDLDNEQTSVDDNVHTSDTDLDDFDLEDEMDLSPEVIEESSSINDLPEMDIEDEILNEDLVDSTVIRSSTELGPDLSSQLEKAAVEESELSVVVLQITGDDLTAHYDLITEKFGGSASIYEAESRKIVLSMTATNSAQAAKAVGSFIESAKDENLEMSAGISSTSSRRVGENRLLGEAMKAADRAVETSKPLIAFKPDPEKYKDFIKNS